MKERRVLVFAERRSCTSRGGTYLLSQESHLYFSKRGEMCFLFFREKGSCLLKSHRFASAKGKTVPKEGPGILGARDKTKI